MFNELKFLFSVIVLCAGPPLFADKFLQVETLNKEDVQATLTSGFATSRLEYTAIDFSSPSDSIQGTLETCSGECTFLLTYGEQAVVVSRNSSGQITESLLIPRSRELESEMHSIDVAEQKIDLQQLPIWSISNRLFGFIEAIDGSTSIIEGTSTKPTGEFNVSDSCLVTAIHKNVKCTDQGTSYYISWTDCDQASCPDREALSTNCGAKSVTVPKLYMHPGYTTPSAAGCTL